MEGGGRDADRAHRLVDSRSSGCAVCTVPCESPPPLSARSPSSGATPRCDPTLRSAAGCSTPESLYSHILHSSEDVHSRLSGSLGDSPPLCSKSRLRRAPAWGALWPEYAQASGSRSCAWFLRLRPQTSFWFFVFVFETEVSISFLLAFCISPSLFFFLLPAFPSHLFFFLIFHFYLSSF